MSKYWRFLPYGVAIGSTAIALLLTFLVEPLLHHSSSTLFFAAVTITTWYGGFRPGLVAIVLSTLVINLFFVPPQGEFTGLSIGDLLQFATLSLVALVIHELISNVRKSQQQGEQLHQRQQTELLLQQQLEQQQLVAEITNRIRQSLNLQEILQTTVDEVRQYLQVDRVIIFQFTPGWGGKVSVESVVDETLAIFPFNIYDPCVGDRYVEPFLQGLVTAKADIYTAGISPCHVAFLAQFQVRANLVVPIRKNNQLWGLLVAHHCVAPRQWQDSEIELLRQIAAQVSIALQQADLFQQVQTELIERQQAEATLQERELLLRVFAQNAPAGIAMLDREMRYVMASQRWVDQYGLDSVESLLHRSHYDIFPEVPERWRQVHQRCLAGAIEKCEDDLFVRADGTPQWISWEVRPWNTTTGEIGGIVIFSTDITERKQSEVSLQQSEARLRLAQAASNSAVWDWDILSNTLIWSPEYYQLYQLDPGTEATYENWLRCIHPDDRDKTSQKTLQALDNASSGFRVEFRIMRLDGIRWFTGIGQVLRDATGIPFRMVGITIDITQQKQTELALQELNTELEQRVIERTAELISLNARLLEILREQQQTQLLLWEQAQLLDLAHDTIMTHDLSSIITFWNQGAERTYGWTKDEALGKESHTLLKTQFPQPLDEIQATLSKQGYWEGELVHFNQDNYPITVASRWVLQKDPMGNPIKILEIDNDITARKQAEQMLALQAVITRNMAEGTCLVRANDATIVYANPKFEQMFGYDPGELNGQHVSIVNYATDSVMAEDTNQAIRALIFQNGEASYEVHNVKKDGTPFWCSATCSVFNHPEYGDVLVAVHQDITARKQTEIALQQQTQQEQLRWKMTQAIRQFLDLPDILNTATEQLRLTLQVDRVAIYRFQPNWSGNFVAESVADGWIKLVDADVQTVWEDTYLQETQGGRFQNHETFVIADIYTAELQPCHIELLEQFQVKAYAVAPVFSGKTLWGLLAIYQNAAARDWQTWEVELLQQIASQLSIAIQQSQLYNQLQLELQERKQAEAVLQETERRWRTLLENVQLIVVGLDQSGYINYINPFFLNLTGYTESEILGKSWFDTFLPPSIQQTIQLAFSEVLTHNAHPYYKNSILTKSGEERFIAWNNTMLQDADGNIIGTISIGEDITERQKVEQMKNEFIGVVSHELRTPLTAIQMSLGLLKTGVYAKKPEKAQRMIEIALLDTSRLVNLVNDILDLERLESGRIVLEKTVCHASDLMQQAVNGMQAIAAEQNITLIVTPTDATVWAAADTIIQTLTNLLSNAIKFSPADAGIHLQVKPQGDTVLFQVTDQGRGIPADHLETIFGRFQQVDASDAREKGGTGLGLSICRSIIERHGGKIWAESTLGEGSSFFFTLPIPLESSV